MANRPAKITQTEISRAIKGATDGGLEIGEVRVNNQTGEIIILAKGSSAARKGADLDKMLGMR